MLVNVSYNNKEITRKINHEVGAPFTIKERFTLGGIGSPKLHITSCSIDIHNLLVLDNNLNTCNIELRPKGIIVGFRSLLESYALVIPYYKLTIYKGDFAVYSIHKDQYFVKVKSDTKAIQKFFGKIRDEKINNLPTAIDDL